MVNAPLDIGMNILQYNEEMSITFPINTSDKLFPNSTETQHEETNTQTEVQPYDRKNKICRKVIDETTLRIYFPRCVIQLIQYQLFVMRLHYEIYWNASIQFQHFPKRKLPFR